MTDQPIAWKEQYAVGLGPPVVRKLPRWIELLLVALVAVGVSVWFGQGAGVGSVGWQIVREILYTFLLVPVAVLFVGPAARTHHQRTRARNLGHVAVDTPGGGRDRAAKISRSPPRRRCLAPRLWWAGCCWRPPPDWLR